MEQKNFSTKVREIVDTVSLRPENYGVILQSSNERVFVVTNRTDLEDMEKIAEALSNMDYVTEYKKGTNFLTVSENPFPTQMEALPTGKIHRIPITFEEALEKLEKYSTYVAVVRPDETINAATIVAKDSDMRPVLSEIAMMLSSGGIFVNYVSGCNFLEFNEVNTEYEVKIVAIEAVIA